MWVVKSKGITCTEYFLNVVSATEIQKMLVTFLKRNLHGCLVFTCKETFGGTHTVKDLS